MSREVSYDVYVKSGVDRMGRDEFGEAVAHFLEQGNAVALKRRLVARGETVRVERSVVHGLSEEEKERRFSDYSRVPEYEPPRDRTSPQRGPESAAEDTGRGAVPSDHQRPSERPWWRRVFGG